MATPIDKLNLLFEGENWSDYYEYYTKTPLFGTSTNRVLENSFSSEEPETNRLRIENLRGLLSEKSNEFIVDAATLFEEIYHSRFGNSSSIFDPRQTQNENGQQSLNIVGQFRMTDSSGNLVEYNAGDVVYYEGNTYIATRSVSGWVPESTHPDNFWRPIDLPDQTIDGSEF